MSHCDFSPPEQADREEDELRRRPQRRRVAAGTGQCREPVKKIREAKRALEQKAAEQLQQAQREYPNAGRPGSPQR